jgi:hypothetical protein
LNNYSSRGHFKDKTREKNGTGLGSAIIIKQTSGLQKLQNAFGNY